MGTTLWITLWLLHTVTADLVVIEPEATDPELTRVTVDSYTAAVGGVDRQHRGQPTTWVALVSWDASKLHAHVEIRRGSADAAVEAVRDVDFSETDDVAQRHRAVGLIIAAHVLGREREQAEEDSRRAAAAAPIPKSEPTHGALEIADNEALPMRHHMPVLGLDLALLAGPALDPGAPRFGVMLRGFARPFDLPVAALVSLRVARRFDSPEVLFLGGSAGALLRLQGAGSAFAVEARGEFVVQRTNAAARDAVTDRSDSGAAWRAGGQLGLEAHFALGRHISLFGGAELSLLAPTVHLDIAGQETGVERALGWGALAGIRYAH